MESEKVSFKIEGKYKAELTGDPEGIRAVLNAFVRGAAEMYVDDQGEQGRSREEVVKAMCDRIRIAQQHHKLGETDGFNCDLRDV